MEGMVLEAYEEKVLSSMYDKRIIGMGYTSIQKIASMISWSGIAQKYEVKKSFERVIRHLASRGYIDLHGKSGNVASLSRLGVAYVVGKLQRS